MLAAHPYLTTPEAEKKKKTKQSDLKQVSGATVSWGGVISNSSDGLASSQTLDNSPLQKTPVPFQKIRGGWRDATLFPGEEQGTLTIDVLLKIRGK